MARTIGAGLQAQFDGQTGENVFLFTVALDGGTQYYTTAGFDQSYGGDTYVGKSITGMSSIKEQLGSSANQFSFTITGASSSFVTTYTGIDYVDRKVDVYLADVSSGVISDALLVYEGYIESIAEAVDPVDGSYSIKITATNPLTLFQRVTGHLASNGYHQSVYSGDLGFEYLKEAQTE